MEQECIFLYTGLNMINTSLVNYKLFIPTKDSTPDEIKLWLRMGYGCITTTGRIIGFEGYLGICVYYYSPNGDSNLDVCTPINIQNYQFTGTDSDVFYTYKNESPKYRLVYFRVNGFYLGGTHYWI